ncbi:site-specific DNA-methyltransferase [Staphylococcus sp. IPLA37011]|uniref:site-specific DNA-methyltransferase n=1 Tax=Staphylococcus TaxID=1279 RepID=UPI0025523E2C|nr:site-specific DNA-methyltransferase [Staphylococcus equorum]MDK9873031.1 site-specific DNA-methyltransferase [Staphylococcus equorum]
METNLQKEINKVLGEFPEYWDEDTLLKNKLIEDIRSYKEKIIEALLSNNLIKDTYALQLPSGSVFKTEDFISMLRFKNYWDNSYTKYTNEVGLTSEGKYLKYNTDIVLDFPHKDSILEGGMTKEDTGKKEIYYHNTLAKEEIDTLLSPKVLVNVEKYEQNGVHTTTQIGVSTEY